MRMIDINIVLWRRVCGTRKLKEVLSNKNHANE